MRDRDRVRVRVRVRLWVRVSRGRIAAHELRLDVGCYAVGGGG